LIVYDSLNAEPRNTLSIFAGSVSEGVGAGMIAITSISGIFYPMLMAWSLYYMFASWQTQVPWHDCSNSFNTPSRYCSTAYTP